jgi:CRP/FNR family transcriptional regulator, cyclic AMP receptor protein
VTKDAIDALAGLVPEAAVSGHVSPRPTRRGAVPGRRVDRPLGKRGADILAQVPLFSGLSKRHLRRLADLADEVRFREGAAVVEEGMLGGTFYVILNGEARVVRGGRFVARLLPGDFFGEISLLDGGPRTASVVAETPLSTVRVFKRAFDKFLVSDPAVSVKILAEVARRLREVERPLTG